ncbi:MAG: hypothetical protein ACRDTM_01660, partial [Micromonosporaceae bacterium]
MSRGEGGETAERGVDVQPEPVPLLSAAIARRSSKSTVFTVPAFAITIAGRPSSSAKAPASRATSTASRPSSVGTRRMLSLPSPIIDSALYADECGDPDSTATSPSAPTPASATETPSCSPSHSRAIANPVTFDIVAPLTKAPPNVSGSPNSSRSHRTV